MKKCKMLISILLAAVMIFSLFTIVPTVSAQSDSDLSGTSTETEDDPGSSSTKPPAYDPSKATVGQYSLDQIDSSLLVRHTGKTSELIDQKNDARGARDATKYTAEEYDDTFMTLSCDDDFYHDLKFDVDDLKSDAQSYAANGELKNPLSGFGYIDPNEMLVGRCNTGSNFETYFNTYDNAQVNDPKDLSATLTGNVQNTGEYHFKDDDNTWNVQCSNGIGIDADGDGTDEFAYFSLLEKEDDSNNQHSGSYIRVQLYDRVESNGSYVWSLVDDYRLIMAYDRYLYGYIPAEESAGYTPLAVGDYDGDGCEDLAYYMPDKGGSDDANDARIIIRKYSHGDSWSGSELKSIYLKDIKDEDATTDSDYVKMGGFNSDDNKYEYILPTVSLSTTSTRLKEMVNLNPDTNSAKRYTTYDDLVISVSVPTAYYNSAVDMNSATEIYGMQNGSIGRLFHYEYEPFVESDNHDDLDGYYRRMTGVSTCDADLNGDGFKEIFTAGWLGSIDPNDDMFHTSDTDVNHQSGYIAWYIALVDIISYNPDTGAYEMNWDTPMQLTQNKNTNQGLYLFNLNYPPIALCAGHFSTDAPTLRDQVCVNGVIYDTQNTLMTGKPLYYSYQADGTQTNYIADTLPGYDKLNFPRSSSADTGAAAVSFKELYAYDAYTAGIATVNCAVSSCVSGRFFTNSEVDQIAVVTWDYNKKDDMNHINMDLAVVSDTASSGWSYKTYNDVVDDEYTYKYNDTLFTADLNVEEDCAVYRWMGAYCSYSAPTPFAVLQAPPYYKEANSMWTYEYGIVHGNTSDSAVDQSAGFCVEGEAEVKMFGDSISLGGGADIAVNYVNNSSWSDERELTQSWAVEPGEDQVVCQTTPIIVNIYEVYQTKPSEEELEASDQAYADGTDEGKIKRSVYQISTPQEPEYTTLTLEQYNSAVEEAQKQYKEENGTLNPLECAPIISADSLPWSSGGDPAGYKHTYNGAFDGVTILNNDSTHCGELTANVSNSSGEWVSNAFEFGYGSSNETGYSVNAGVHAKIGAKLGRVEASIEPGIESERVVTSGTGSMDGTHFEVAYYYPNASQQVLGGLQYSNEVYDGLLAPEIMHYAPSSGTWYNYSSTAECYCCTAYLDEYGIAHDIMAMSFYTTMKSDQKEDDQSVTGDNGYVKNPTPAQLNYLYPPEPPEDFTVQSMEHNADGKGSLDVTLVWNSENRNSARKPDGYNIYMSDADANSSTTIHLQNKDGMIHPAQNSSYTTASFHLAQGEYAEEDINFYIVPVYLKDQNGAQYVMEGTIGGQTSIADPYASDKGMVITKQPKTYWMQDNNQEETATFTIEAVKDEDFLSTDDVTFLWQEYNEETEAWDKLYEQTVKDTGSASDDPQVFKSSYSVKIEGDKKADFIDKGIRCVVQCSNFSKTSDLVSFYYLNENCILLGDADNNGKVDVIDVTVIQRKLAKMAVETFSIDAADIDSDGAPTVMDATLIQRYLADLEVGFPINEYIITT